MKQNILFLSHEKENKSKKNFVPENSEAKIKDLSLDGKPSEVLPKSQESPLSLHRKGKNSSLVKDKGLQFLDYDQNMVIAYLARKFPESFNISLRVLSELKKKFPTFQPKTCLDFGAGLAPATWALSLTYEDLSALVCVEPSMYMSKLGKYLSQDLEKVIWLNSFMEVSGLQIKTFDIVMCSFVLEEVRTPRQRELIVKSLYEKVSPEGFVVFVLPGSPLGFRFLTDLRNLFIAKPRTECNIVAPCPHHLKCPLEEHSNSWCRFEQIFPRYTKAVLPKIKSEKTQIKSRFSYLVVRKGHVIQNRDEASTLQEQSVVWPRIVTPVRRRGGHSLLNLCNERGEFESRVVRKSQGNRVWLRCSKRLRWGDQWWYPLLTKKKYTRDHFRDWMMKK